MPWLLPAVSSDPCVNCIRCRRHKRTEISCAGNCGLAMRGVSLASCVIRGHRHGLAACVHPLVVELSYTLLDDSGEASSEQPSPHGSIARAGLRVSPLQQFYSPASNCRRQTCCSVAVPQTGSAASMPPPPLLDQRRLSPARLALRVQPRGSPALRSALRCSTRQAQGHPSVQRQSCQVLRHQ